MQKSFKNRLKKLIFWLTIGFVILFIFRLFYGYTKVPDNYSYNESRFFEDEVVAPSYSQKNYATKKYQVKSSAPNRSAIDVEQKYEKIADVKTVSSDFEEEAKAAKEMVKKYDALVQFEQKSGNDGDRMLSLVIGVPPDNFEALYNSLIKVGDVQSKHITQKDKTNEYKELNAKKKSLEKIRESLIELKSKGGKISEYVELENRILEIEQQLQELGVSLGDFDDENEFCTVNFSLTEGRKVHISIMHRIKVALEWTVSFYLKLMITFAFLSFFAYMILLIIDKLKIIERIINKKE